MKGYYTNGDYWGFVGKGFVGANERGYMQFETEDAYVRFYRKEVM